MLLLCLLFIMPWEDSWAYYLDCEITDIEIAAESHVILQKAMSAASKAQAAEEAFEKAMPAASKAQAAEEASGARGSSTVETAEEHWRQQRSQWSLRPTAKACWRPKNESRWHREWRRQISKAKRQPRPQIVSALASPYAFGNAQATVTER